MAIGLVAVAIALLMAPAALHRHTEPMAISQRFINVSSRLLMIVLPQSRALQNAFGATSPEHEERP